MPKNAVIRSSIMIEQPAYKVFEFISEGTNDPKWRKEVDHIETSSAPGLGTAWMEYSTFYKLFQIITPTTVVEFNYPTRVVSETPKSHSPWLRSIREVEAINDNQSLFTYELSFDSSLLKQITYIIPPVSLIEFFYLHRMRKYLRYLKKLMEAQNGKQ